MENAEKDVHMIVEEKSVPMIVEQPFKVKGIHSNVIIEAFEKYIGEDDIVAAEIHYNLDWHLRVESYWWGIQSIKTVLDKYELKIVYHQLNFKNEPEGNHYILQGWDIDWQLKIEVGGLTHVSEFQLDFEKRIVHVG